MSVRVCDWVFGGEIVCVSEFLSIYMCVRCVCGRVRKRVCVCECVCVLDKQSFIDMDEFCVRRRQSRRILL